MTESAPLLELRGVVKSYAPAEIGGGEAVLRGVDLTVEPGATLAVTGPSGSGKSTLLGVMGTLEPPDAGEVLWEGRPLAVSRYQVKGKNDINNVHLLRAPSFQDSEAAEYQDRAVSSLDQAHEPGH